MKDLEFEVFRTAFIEKDREIERLEKVVGKWQISSNGSWRFPQWVVAQSRRASGYRGSRRGSVQPAGADE